MEVIDYAKYENMNERQLLNSLLNAEKRNEKLRIDFEYKLKNSSELIRFLKTKLNEKINKLHYNFVPLEKSSNFQSYIKMTEKEKQQIKDEVIKEINMDYDDDL